MFQGASAAGAIISTSQGHNESFLFNADNSINISSNEIPAIKISCFDWLILIVGYSMLLFPFPGWLLLYVLFNEVNLIAPLLGSIFTLVSLPPGVYLLAAARQNRLGHMDHWIYYAAIVSIFSMTGLFFTIGFQLISFLPALVFGLFMCVACRGEEKAPQENITVFSICR